MNVRELLWGLRWAAGTFAVAALSFVLYRADLADLAAIRAGETITGTDEDGEAYVVTEDEAEDQAAGSLAMVWITGGLGVVATASTMVWWRWKRDGEPEHGPTGAALSVRDEPRYPGSGLPVLEGTLVEDEMAELHELRRGLLVVLPTVAQRVPAITHAEQQIALRIGDEAIRVAGSAHAGRRAAELETALQRNVAAYRQLARVATDLAARTWLGERSGETADVAASRLESFLEGLRETGVITDQVLGEAPRSE